MEAAGAFDSDAEMVLSCLGLGQVKFGFKGHADVAMLARTIGGSAAWQVGPDRYEIPVPGTAGKNGKP